MAENLILKNGILAYNEKRYTDALKYFKKLLAESGGNALAAANANYYLGLTYIRIGDLSNAVEHLRKIIRVRLGPTMAVQLRMILGYIYALKEENKLAMEIFASVLKIRPDNVQALAALGYLCFKMKDTKRAVRFLKKALKRDKNNANALNSIGFIYSQTEDKLQEALKECEKALQLKPGYPAYLDSLGWAYLKAGNVQMARKYLSEAMEKLPENTEVREHFRELVLKEMTFKRKDKID
jgi:tetratricopeptide (TPR) repeat protein